MVFQNRYDAAARLGKLLQKYTGENGVIVGLPRGGIPLAYYLAKLLNFEMVVIPSKKIGHPFNKEYAIGAVTLQGRVIKKSAGVSQDYINSETARLRKILLVKEQFYGGSELEGGLKDKIVIIVDDGIATGCTMEAVIDLVNNKRPQKTIIAVPVAPPSAVAKLAAKVDEITCLHQPADFYAVGVFYRDFSPVSDKEVRRLVEMAPGLG